MWNRATAAWGGLLPPQRSLQIIVKWRMPLLIVLLFLPLAQPGQAADTAEGRERFELQRDLAYALEKTARPGEAVALYRQLIRSPHPTATERYRLHKRLAYALAAMGEDRCAAVEFEALLAAPDLEAAEAERLRAALAHSLQRSGQNRRAAWQWQRVLNALPDGDPEIPRTQLRLADLFEKLDQDAAAAAIYANLLNSPVDGEDLRYRFAWLHNRHHRYGEAWALIEAWPRPHPDPKRFDLQARTAYWAGADADALPLYPLLMKARPGDPELHAQYADLLRRNGRMAEASAVLTRLVAQSPDDSDRRALLVETLLDAGKAAAAQPHLKQLLKTHPDPPRIRLLAARAFAETKQFREAVAHLQALDRLRPLTPAERLWLGDLLRGTGQDGEARHAYAAAIEAAPAQMPARAWMALADLDVDAGDPARALANYERGLALLPEDGAQRNARAAVQLKIARTATRLGDHRRAGQAYGAYLAVHPGDGGIQLEAARAFAARGAHAEAARRYRQVAALREDAGLEMELARVFTAVGAYDEAEAYARRAVASQPAEPEGSEDPPRRLLAEILLYSGRPDAAAKLLERYLQDSPEDPSAILLQAEIALARDRSLLAYTRFREAAAFAETNSGVDGNHDEKIRLGLGRSALRRGDLMRADRALAPLDAAPQQSEAAAALLKRYHEARAPRLSLLAGLSSDSNDLVLRQGGPQAKATIGPDHLPLTLGYTRGEVAQDGVDFQRQALRLGLAPHYLWPDLSLEGYLGVEAVGDADHAGGATLPIGEVAVRRFLPDDASYGLAVTRETIWTAHDSPELHRYHRVTKLAAVEPAFARTDLRLLMDKRLGEGGGFWLGRLGVDAYSDDNSRLWGYTHLQHPLTDTENRWLALKPNLFYEGFAHGDDAYFSPDSHLSLGLILQAIERFGAVALDVEVNPQLLITDGETGWGGHWHLKLTAEWGRLFTGGGIFGFYDHNDDYLLWRIAGQAGWRF